MKADQPLTRRAFRSDLSHGTQLHAHRLGQFTFVSRGLISIVTETGAWVCPTGRLAWIPPGLRHASRSRGPVEGWLVFAGAEHSRHLPSEVAVLKASPLLIAALDRVGGLTARDGAIKNAIAEIIRFEVQTTTFETFGIPLPISERLRVWAIGFLDTPNATVSIDDGATATGMSRRSFTRRFSNETGKTFSGWKRLVMVHHAMGKLANDEQVGTIAFSLGYENPSAFIAMFKAMRGMSPHRFVIMNRNSGIVDNFGKSRQPCARPTSRVR
jgi:AraC-like DNA-binding protein